jgi:hypothetical protein
MMFLVENCTLAKIQKSCFVELNCHFENFDGGLMDGLKIGPNLYFYPRERRI